MEEGISSFYFIRVFISFLFDNFVAVAWSGKVFLFGSYLCSSYSVAMLLESAEFPLSCVVF